MAFCGPSGVIDDAFKYRGLNIKQLIDRSRYESGGLLILNPRRNLDEVIWLKEQEKIQKIE